MARIKNQKTVPALLAAITVLLVGARIVSRCTPSNEAKVGQGSVKWVPLANAEEIARKTGKPILYDFTAEWCGPCHLLDDAVFEDAKLAAKINEQFVPVRVTDPLPDLRS